MKDITLTAVVTDGKITFNEENEIRELALETGGLLGLYLYLEEIPINSIMYIKWDERLVCWVLNVRRSEITPHE